MQDQFSTYERTPFSDQLAVGFAALRFAPPLEAEFRAEYRTQSLRRTFIGFAVAAGMYLLFLAVQLLWGGDSAAAVANNAARICIIGAMTVPAVAVLLRRLGGLNAAIVGSYLVLAVGISFIEVNSWRHGIDRHYEGLIFACMHCYLFSGLLFRAALACALAIPSIYFLASALAGMPGTTLGFEMLFLLLANIVGMVAAYQLEYRERDNYLRRRALDHLARFDSLTGLMNRDTFFRHLHQLFDRAVRQRDPVCLMVLDVDHFKRVNDSLGHLAGDRCLQQVAAVLSRHCRDREAHCARWGGDEFLLALARCQPQRAARLAAALRDEIGALEIELPDSDFGHVTVSIGYVVIEPQHADIVEKVIAYADQAVYRAKELGRNRAERFLPGPESSGATGTHPGPLLEDTG